MNPRTPSLIPFITLGYGFRQERFLSLLTSTTDSIQHLMQWVHDKSGRSVNVATQLNLMKSGMRGPLPLQTYTPSICSA